MLVRDVMAAPAVTAREEATLTEVAQLMRDKNIGAVPIVDASGGLRGIITEGDFTGMARCVPFTLELAPVIFGMRAATIEELRTVYAKAALLKARDVMSTSVRTCAPGDTLGKVIHLLMEKDLKHLPVVDGGKVVGMLARHDVLKVLLKA
jgi:CBS domain-containing protein